MIRKVYLLNIMFFVTLIGFTQDGDRKCKAILELNGSYSMAGLTYSFNPGLLIKESHQIGVGYSVNQVFSSSNNLYQGYSVSYDWWSKSAKHPKLYFGIGPSFRHMFGQYSSYFEAFLNMKLKVRMIKGFFFNTSVAAGIHSIVTTDVYSRFNGGLFIGLSYEI
jgi:hypothetical protein